MRRRVAQKAEGAARPRNTAVLAASIDDPFLSSSIKATTARAYSPGTLFGATAAVQRPPRIQHAPEAKAIASDDTNTSSSSTLPTFRALASNSALRLQRAHIVRSTPHAKRVPLSPIKRRVVPARRKRGDEGDEVESGPRRRRKTDDDDDGGDVEELESYARTLEFELEEDTHLAPFEEDEPSLRLAGEADSNEDQHTLDEDILPWNEHESTDQFTPDVPAALSTHAERRAETDAVIVASTDDGDRIGQPLGKRATTTTRDRRPSRATITAVSTRQVRATPPQITSSVDDAFSRAAAALSSRQAANSAASSSIRSLVFASFSRAAASVESRSRAEASISASRSRAQAASVASLFSAAAESISVRDAGGTTAAATSALSSTSAASASAASSALASTATQTSFSITSTSLATSSSETGVLETSSTASATSGPTAAASTSSNHRLRDILLPALLVPLGLILLATALFLCTKRRNSKDQAGTAGNESSWGGSGNDGAMIGAPPAAALMAAAAAGTSNSRSGSSSNNPSQDSFGTSPSAIGVAYSGVEPRSKWGRRSLTDVIAGGVRAAGVGGSSRGRGQVTSTTSSFGGGRQPSMTGISDYAGTAIDYQPGQMRPVATPSILSVSMSGSNPGTPVFQQRYDSPQHYDPFAPTIIPVAGAFAHRSSSTNQEDYGDDRGSFTSRDSRDDFDPFARQDLNIGGTAAQGAQQAVPWTEQAGLGCLSTPVLQPPAFERAETAQTAVTARTHQTGDSTDVYQTDMAPSGAESAIDDTSDEELLGTPTVIQQPVHFGSSGSSNGGSGNGSGSSRGSVARANMENRPSSSHSDRSTGTPRLGMGHGNAGGVRRGDGSWW
ncbi:BZ3500_MvSof-1268-A1-R1_Chr1-3g01918 [Microbotryum saponariae]|uniref:BZ3500_MvSof-1268-A1-R1_Chr1-3g01918 protein n=1 Tax=Microbotryum saponariae TaxID=289078 RepID=A0A2X0MFY4_9BASI|nr:BZ3500_MvSof-1268-A1-R1_Chr1-3g01918 [Microbotryum saponariae]SCZ94897.1 BZ3501_MvSof-1269-A2-R1_Chr1-3g01520 [Microbotryum saponariae]